MRIIFICGCIEPEKDGVGDYTQQLAIELKRHGNEVAVLALNDKYALTEFDGMHCVDSINFAVLRIPGTVSSIRRTQLSKEYISKFNPDWLSIQYVPYSFQNKGLPFKLPKFLKQIAGDRKWHIMFHETWVGISKISSLKHRTTGIFQRSIANSLHKTLRPKLVTTSNRLYQILLLNTDIPAVILPLFSNIPITTINTEFIFSVYQRLSIDPLSRNQFHIIGIFGTLYPEAKLQEAIAQQLIMTTANHKHLVVIGFGRVDQNGTEEFNHLIAAISDKIRFVHLGEQPVENVSSLMQTLDLAISCTPEAHITKSGVFAAMKLHGLKVIASKGKMIPEYHTEIIKFNEASIKKPTQHWSVGYIAEQYLALLINNT